MMKKFLLIFISAVMLFSVAACAKLPGQEEPTQTPLQPTVEPTATPQPIINYTLLDCTSGGYTDLWETPVGEQLFALTRVYLDVATLEDPSEAGAQQAVAAMIASGDLPDFIDAGSETRTLIAAGKLVDLTDLANASAIVARRYRSSDLQRQKNLLGGLYALPNERFSDEAMYVQGGYYVNYDVMAANGFAPITTLAQYANAIKNYYDANPKFNEEKNLTFLLPGGETFADMFYESAVQYLAGNMDNGLIAVNELLGEGTLLADEYYIYEYIKFLNDLYLQDYIDDSFFTMTQEDYLAALRSGRVLGAFDMHANIQQGNDALAAAGLQNRALVAVPVVLEGVAHEYYRGHYSLSTDGISITTACRDVPGAFAFLERLMVDDTQKLIHWGIEGEDYTLDAQGVVTFEEDRLADFMDPAYRESRGIGFAALMLAEGSEDPYYGQFDDYNWVNPLMQGRYILSRYQPYEQQLLSGMGAESFCAGFSLPHVPTHDDGKLISAEMAQQENYAALENKVRAITEKYYVEMIKAKNHKTLEKHWASYREELEKLQEDITAYEAEFNRLLAESKAQYGH